MIPNDAARFHGAPCVGSTHLFFTATDEAKKTANARVAQAKAICRQCPHMDACRRYAMDNYINADWHGVWGGLTPKERRAEMRRLGMPRRPERNVA